MLRQSMQTSALLLLANFPVSHFALVQTTKESETDMRLISEARNVLFPLVQGIDPQIGELLFKNHRCCNPQITHALAITMTLLKKVSSG